MGWCDGVQARDCNTVRATRSAPRAETLAARAGSLGMSWARASETESGSRWCDRNSIPPSRPRPKA